VDSLGCFLQLVCISHNRNATPLSARMLCIMSTALLALIIVFGRTADGQVQTFGDWKVDLSDPSLYAAATVNDSNHELGQYCLFDKDSYCDWYFETDTTCTDGSKYPVLANADTEALYLEVVCLGEVKGRYAYAFTDFDKVDKLIRASKQVGFAVPLQGDTFAVVRWNLNGVTNALSAMRTAAEKRSKPAEKRSKSIPKSTRGTNVA
jgi:hypothetical protein